MASVSYQNLPEVFGKYRWRWYPRKYFGFEYFLISQKLSRPRQVGQGGPVALSPWPPSLWHPMPAIPVLQFLSQFDQLDQQYIDVHINLMISTWLKQHLLWFNVVDAPVFMTTSLGLHLYASKVKLPPLLVVRRPHILQSRTLFTCVTTIFV